MEFVHWFGFAVSLISLALTAAGALAVFGFIRLRELTPDELSGSFRGISVLKPLKGVDPETQRNLESFFWLTHPQFELLFCVAEGDDPAVALVKSLMEAHPDVPARLFVDGTEIGPNPKINNIRRAYRSARFETILISDSNIRVRPQYLQEMDRELGDRDMVWSVVSGRQARNFSGGMEAVFLGGFYSRPMVLTALAGFPCVMGKSMIFRRAAMEAVGGLESLSSYLAEDFMAGEKFRRAKFRVGLSHFPVEQVVGRPSFRAFWGRHLRWGRIRKTHAPLPFLVELFFTNALMAAALAGWALAPAGVPVALSSGVVLSAWFFLDLLAARATGSRGGWRVPFCWLGRELLHAPLWLHIAAGNQIVWKGKTWRMDGEGKLNGGTGQAEESHVPDEGMAARPQVERPRPRPGMQA